MSKSDPNKVSKFRGEFCSLVLDRLRRGCSIAEIEERLNNIVPKVFITYGSGYKRRPGIHPSEIGGCKLRLYYSALGTEYRSPPRFEPRMEIGSAIHEIIQTVFRGLDEGAEDGKRYSVLIEPELDDTEYAKRYGIVGNTDIVFCVDDKPVLVTEIKSGRVPSTPFTHHRYQGTVYQMCFKAPYLWYYYTNRDGDKWNCSLFGRPDKKLVAQIRETLKEVIARAIALSPPPPEPDFMVCVKGCGYHYLCKPKF